MLGPFLGTVFPCWKLTQTRWLAACTKERSISVASKVARASMQIRVHLRSEAIKANRVHWRSSMHAWIRTCGANSLPCTSRWWAVEQGLMEPRWKASLNLAVPADPVVLRFNWACDAALIKVPDYELFYKLQCSNNVQLPLQVLKSNTVKNCTIALIRLCACAACLLTLNWDWQLMCTTLSRACAVYLLIQSSMGIGGSHAQHTHMQATCACQMTVFAGGQL